MESQNPRSGPVPRGYTTIERLPEATRERLRAYAELVRLWAPRLDLVSSGETSRFERRHIDDSLRALVLLDALPDGPAADVGSGAGLPGVPLAIAGRERPWRLFEPRRKRAGFLEEVVRELALEHVEIAATTAQEEAAGTRRYVAATARALAPPKDAFALLVPLLRPGGTAIVWVGESAGLPPEAGLFGPGLATIPKMGANREKLD